jgi:hypothetical protein
MVNDLNYELRNTSGTPPAPFTYFQVIGSGEGHAGSDRFQIYNFGVAGPVSARIPTVVVDCDGKRTTAAHDFGPATVDVRQPDQVDERWGSRCTGAPTALEITGADGKSALWTITSCPATRPAGC